MILYGEKHIDYIGKRQGMTDKKRKMCKAAADLSGIGLSDICRKLVSCAIIGKNSRTEEPAWESI